MNFYELTVLLVVATVWWAAKDWNNWVYMVLIVASGSCMLSIIGNSISLTRWGKEIEIVG